MLMRRCGARCTASTYTLAPTAWAASMIGARSGCEPSRFDAPGTVTHFVRSSIEVDHVLRRQLPVCRIERCQHVLGTGRLGSTPPRGDVGVVVEPGADDPVARAQRRARPPVTRRTSAMVMFGPEADARRGRPRAAGRRSPECGPSSRWHSSAAANGPPLEAVLPLAIQAVMARDGRVDHLGAGRAVEARPLRAGPRGTGGEGSVNVMGGGISWSGQAAAWLPWPDAWPCAPDRARCCAGRGRRPRCR